MFYFHILYFASALAKLLFFTQQPSHFLIEVRVNALRLIKYIIFFFRFLLGLFRRDFAFVGQYLVFAECQEFIDTCRELRHVECVFTLNEVFYIVKETCNSTLQLSDFLLL